MSKIINDALDQYGAEPFEQQQLTTSGVEAVKGKGKLCHTPLQAHRQGAHFLSFGHEPVGGYTTKVCGAWPV